MSSLHEPDEQLELYALDRLPETAMERVEEHILVCDYCRGRLDHLGEFAYTMRQSLRATYLGRVPRSRGWFEGWHLKFAIAGALAVALLLSVLAYRNTGQFRVPPVATLTLTAVRGANSVVSEAREYDLTLADADGDNRTVEVADASGRTVWKGAGTIQGSGLHVRVPASLKPGSYLVRLKSDSGELIHEYGLDVRR